MTQKNKSTKNANEFVFDKIAKKMFAFCVISFEPIKIETC